VGYDRLMLVRPTELQQELKVFQIVDTRPAHLFAAGRIPGAIHLELWGLSLNDTDPAPLRAFLWSVSHYLTMHGIDPGRPLVIYEEDSGMRAARAFWFFEYFGHPDVRVLDGGFRAWTAAGFPVETGAASAPRKGTWPDDRSTSRNEDVLAGWREVFAASGAPAPRKDVTILDTRSEGEHRGTIVRSKRGGAIPGSVHLEWKENLTPEGTFKAPDELRRLYEAKGVTPGNEVITYCQGGYRAAHSYLALRLLGYPRVRNYIASWGEWGDREELPVERGDN
jgi:thiosulfate/3-mercaptopyruvate sulfurtransferase